MEVWKARRLGEVFHASHLPGFQPERTRSLARTIVILEDDIMFGTGIEATLRGLGYEPVFADTTPTFDRLLKGSPALVLVNVGSRTLDWEHLVDHAKNESQWRHVPILAYGPHVDLELRQRALEAGCDTVVGRSAVANTLSSLVEKWAWQPDSSLCSAPPPPGLVRGIEEFNQRKFFECHETIEAAWMEEPRSIRLLYQGILQVGVSLYHVQQGNWRGAMKVLTRAIPKLAHFEPTCMGIDVSGLLVDAQHIREYLIQLGPEQVGEFDPALLPTIRRTAGEK
jgi:CheY-like chemotaxis protein